MQLTFFNIIIIILVAILIYIILYNNKNIQYKKFLPKQNIKPYSTNKEYMTIQQETPIYNKTSKPSEFKPIYIDSIKNSYNNNYDVQPGLYDNNELPQKKIGIVVGDVIKNTLENENNDNKSMADIYNNLIDGGYKNITKEVLDNNTQLVPGYKGYTLDINNWNLYKDDLYINGGSYDNLIGIDSTRKENNYRVAGDYDDFEIKEFM